MQDDGIERQPLLASDRTLAAYVLQAVEDAIESWPNAVSVLRQRIRALVRGAKRARAAMLVKVLAERLARSTPRALGDRGRELELIFSRDLVHLRSPLPQILRFTSPPRTCSDANGIPLARL